MVEKDLRTRGESSLSTLNAWRAADARRGVGNGRSIVLVVFLVLSGLIARGRDANSEQGKSGSG